jgi:DNA processing protein
MEQRPALSEVENAVLQTLGPYPVHIDELVRQLQMDAGRLSAVLLQLELKGIVVQQSGKFFSTSGDRRI